MKEKLSFEEALNYLNNLSLRESINEDEADALYEKAEKLVKLGYKDNSDADFICVEKNFDNFIVNISNENKRNIENKLYVSVHINSDGEYLQKEEIEKLYKDVMAEIDKAKQDLKKIGE